MKKAIIVFTKVPKVGVVKTRLTEARGGILTPEEANSFYEACLLDVIDVSLSIDQVDIWICYNQDGDRSYLDTLLAQVNYPQKIAGVFADEGGSFDDCMQYAADFILKSGNSDRLADAVLIIGGDIPTLQPAILQEALAKLEKLSASAEGQKAVGRQLESNGTRIGACLVEGACQEGGFSIVGFTAATPFRFQKVFYNMDGVTALDMLVNKAEEENIPLAVLEMVPDVDIPVDLASIMPVLRALELAAKIDPAIQIPQKTSAFLKEMGLQSLALPPAREAV
jgi:glycosyltransferase A (GT-A) superfamily protein (DUF2064 family)